MHEPRQTSSKTSPETILHNLEQLYPDAHCELRFANPFQLLIATILSAQATDRKVNQITERLFKKYPTPQSLLQTSQEEFEQEIKEIGLYHNKAKNILATCRILVEKYQGNVPENFEQLTELPGVGRKTANVILSNAFGIPALAVDTHVLRVANRLGLASGQNPERVEEQLKSIIPKEQWSHAHHLLIWHGRRICQARHPQCSPCSLRVHCPAAQTHLT